MKKILIQFGISDRRLRQIIPATQKAGLEIDYFSYYGESRKLDDFPVDFLENEYLVFTTIPVLLYCMQEKVENYSNPEQFINNEHLINMVYGRDLHMCEQEFIFDGMAKGLISELPMLNAGSEILTPEQLKGRVFDTPVFMKPNSAYKQFIGGTTLPGETFEDFMIRKKHCGKEVDVMLSSFHEIHSEYRFFIYDDVPLASSSYIVDGKFKEDYPVPEAVKAKAVELAKLYQPTKCFTLDLCLLKNGDIKIVEYNHFSASGNYNCEMEHVMNAFKEDLNYVNTLKK